jgi:hypothetical protein
MKYLLAFALMIGLNACTTTMQGPASNTAQNTEAATATQPQVLYFVGPMDLTLTLASQDRFETAVMTDNADRSFQMHVVPAASGLRMSNGKGVSIHFKNGDGTVELVEGKPISIREVKK